MPSGPSLISLTEKTHRSRPSSVRNSKFHLLFHSHKLKTEHYDDVITGTGVASKVIELLSASTTTIQTPALRVCGNIVTGSDKITQTMLDMKVLPQFAALLQSNRKGLRKEAAWAISNITAGNREQTQQVTLLHDTCHHDT